MTKKIEAELIFIYNTIKAYNQYEEYIEGKLKGKNVKNKIIEGYLISQNYINYWIKFSDYVDLKELVCNNNYQNIKITLYKYRKTNKYKRYLPEPKQKEFKSSEELYKEVIKENKSYVLIDYYFWQLICSKDDIKAIGKTKYSLDKNSITFHYNEFDYCTVLSDDNIINSSKEIRLIGFDVVRQSDKEEKELEKLLLLYAYEHEMKSKINDYTYKESEFNDYYLISKEWIEEYKKYYHYEEICKLIEGKKKLKNLLDMGFEKAKENIKDASKYIFFNDNNKKKKFPENLKNNNTFLCEREDVLISNRYSVSYWINFELVNEELKNILMFSEANGYAFDNVSDARCLIACGKLFINLSNDEFNQNSNSCEIGTINNSDMIFSDEYIFRYDNEEDMADNLNYAAEDFLEFQKKYLNFGSELESELYSKDGAAYGIAYKIPLHD